MTEKSRTEYSARNTSIAMASRVFAILMGYVTRIVFTHTLSESYVGVNGLFTDILNVLALSELGVGTALTYALYKPIAENDVERQKSLMRLFKWLYRCVALIIAAAGLCVVPFLGSLVKDPGDVSHITFIYLLYLANSVVSYLLIYKKTLIDAHQLSYIGVLYHTGFLFAQYILQIAFLLATKNFILYLSVYLVCTVGNNVCVAKKADSLYPYLRDKNVEPIPKEEKQSIVKNMKAMLMHKIGNVVVNNTDNILLTAMVGLVSAGKYSNYYLIIGSVRQVLDQAFQGITASVGNLGVTEDKGRVRKIFEASFFIGQWLYGFASICLFELLNYVVSFSFGENYLFGRGLVLVLCVNFFVTGMRQASLVFRDSLGLFWYDRYKSIAEAIINLAVSIVLTLKFGVVGVFLGTFVSTMTTSFWIEPYVLYSKKLESSAAPYFIRYGLYSLGAALAGILTHFACNLAGGSGFGAMALDLLICCAVPNAVFLILYCRTKEFKFVCKKGWELVGRKFGGETCRETLSDGEKQLLEVLRCALCSENKKFELSDGEWEKLMDKADRHAVLSLMYDVLAEQELPEALCERRDRTARRFVLQSCRLANCTYRIVKKLEEKGVAAAVLKGVSAAELYPVPELRKSGDVDILIADPSQLEAAREAVSELGFSEASEQHSRHHLVMNGSSGIEVELHCMLAEPFDNSAINRYLEGLLREIPGHIVTKNIIGYDFPVLDGAYQAYSLLIHMLQHFLRSGFGVKLLCDWTVFWNAEVLREDFEGYMKMARESGLEGFSRMISSVCAEYLGLRRDSVILGGEPMESAEAEAYAAELLEAEEFGKSSSDRMVVLRGTSVFDYLREFHHMTLLNFPRAGRIIPLLPALWAVTLVRFLRNNRRIRGVSAWKIFRKAGMRSRRIAALGLFKATGREK